MWKIIMFDNKMLGLLLLVVQFAQIFAGTQCIYGDRVCWINFANSVIVPKLADGIPELGIERLDEMHLKDVDINNGETIFKLTNATVSGFKDTLIDNIRNYVDLKIIRIVFHTNLTVVGTYSTRGSFFTLPISTNGKLTLLMQNVSIEMLAPYDILKDENGKNRINLKYFQKYFHSNGGINFKFENKEKNTKDFDEKVAVVVNENWRLFEEYSAEAWSDYTRQIFNAVKQILASYEIKK